MTLVLATDGNDNWRILYRGVVTRSVVIKPGGKKMSARFNNEVPDGALCAYSSIMHLIVEILAAEVNIAVPNCISVGYFPFSGRSVQGCACIISNYTI